MSDTAPRTGLTRAVGSMAMGTAVSRMTGVLRVLVLAYVLGISPLADAFNLANTIPNMLFDIVLGGVLGATFIPVFIERLASRTEREAWRSISAVVTISVVVLGVATVIFLIAAPWLIDAFTMFDHARLSHSAVQLERQRQVATTLLRWFVPQIFLYGVLSIGGALLNVRRVFGAPMWVPIANNVVCIAVLGIFAMVAPTPTLSSVAASPGQLALLGAGTTLGVAVQAFLLIPSLRKAELGRLRWRFDLKDDAVKTIARLGSWTFGFVVMNQLSLFVVIALAFSVGGGGPVSAYTYAYAFMQMPYAVVAVSVMSAVTPDLAHQHASEDPAAFTARFGSGLRAVLAMIVPAAVVMFLLARPLIALLLGHGNAHAAQTLQTGTALAELSLGLVGFTVFQFVVRAMQTMHHAKAVFWLYVVENIINVVLAVILVGPLGLAGVALSVSIAYSIGAVGGLLLLHHWLGRLGTPGCYQPLGRVLIASGVMGAVILVVSNLSGAESGPALLGRVVGSIIAGALAYLAVISLLGRHQAGRRSSLQDSEPTP
ncbi:MAG: murein biosynthesis integral membrane protein MurJ [Actinomycetes bacterium]